MSLLYGFMLITKDNACGWSYQNNSSIYLSIEIYLLNISTIRVQQILDKKRAVYHFLNFDIIHTIQPFCLFHCNQMDDSTLKNYQVLDSLHHNPNSGLEVSDNSDFDEEIENL